MNYEVLYKTLDFFDTDDQVIKCVSECNELATALLHYRELKATDEQVIDEIADVIICAKQMAILFGENEVGERIEYKINRLNEMIK